MRALARFLLIVAGLFAASTIAASSANFGLSGGAGIPAAHLRCRTFSISVLARRQSHAEHYATDE